GGTDSASWRFDVRDTVLAANPGALLLWPIRVVALRQFDDAGVTRRRRRGGGRHHVRMWRRRRRRLGQPFLLV
ncbi:MAG: hypothetical protein ACREBW_10635, partial [Candidatus Micrarchaeaceae archaeon]